MPSGSFFFVVAGPEASAQPRERGGDQGERAKHLEGDFGVLQERTQEIDDGPNAVLSHQLTGCFLDMIIFFAVCVYAYLESFAEKFVVLILVEFAKVDRVKLDALSGPQVEFLETIPRSELSLGAYHHPQISSD